MSDYFCIAGPLVRLLPAETAHGLTVALLKTGLVPHQPSYNDPILSIRLWGRDFKNPVGLAAGFDKNAEVPDAMLGQGFGFVEIGSVTPRPQPGNPRPRLFRLTPDQAVINRMGFNNDGAEAVARRLHERTGTPGHSPSGIIGVNIGANKDSPDRIADYATMTRIMAPLARYLTINISSPNTPGLRDLQDEGALAALLDAVIMARGGNTTPIFLKLAPDLGHADIDSICRIAIDRRIDALIISNTTISRPPLLSPLAGESGGLWRGFAPVEAVDLAIGAAGEEKTAAAEPRALRFDHPQRQHSRDRRVGCAASGAQDFGACSRCARVGGGNHAMIGCRWRSGNRCNGQCCGD